MRRIEPSPEAQVDPDRLQQVFLNLFMNAADAMPQGGILEVGVAPAGPEAIEISVRVAGGSVGHSDPTGCSKERRNGDVG